MSVTYPLQTGGTIAASDSSSISSDIQVASLPVGTRVWNDDVGSFFKLTVSTEALVTDEILAVKGITGLRWKIDVTSNAETADAPTDAATFQADLVAGSASITTLGSDGNNLDITGLNGDTDGDYEFEGVLTLTGNATQNVVTMQPENLATNQNGQFIYGSTTTPATGATVLMPIALPTNTADSICTFRGKLSSKSGRVRVFTCVGLGINTDASKIMTWSIVNWSGTGTVITKLRINADHGMRAGSFVRLVKLRNVT